MNLMKVKRYTNSCRCTDPGMFRMTYFVLTAANSEGQ